jgi:hypothetical protein
MLREAGAYRSAGPGDGRPRTVGSATAADFYGADEAACFGGRWNAVGSQLDERGRRLFAAAEVRTAGRGGLAVVSKITGLARSTINRGEDDLDAEPLPKRRVRRAGGGRRAASDGLSCQIHPKLEVNCRRVRSIELRQSRLVDGGDIRRDCQVVPGSDRIGLDCARPYLRHRTNRANGNDLDRCNEAEVQQSRLRCPPHRDRTQLLRSRNRRPWWWRWRESDIQQGQRWASLGQAGILIYRMIAAPRRAPAASERS